MITEYLKNCKDLTPTEEALRNFILENPQCLLDFSIKELAHACHVGVASVNRLCIKLGYGGYSDFKVEYIKNYKDLARLKEIDRTVPFSEESTVDEVIEQVPYIYEKAIGYTQIALDRRTVIRCTEKMQNSFVMIFGTGVNKALAEIFVYKLEELGLNAKAADSFHYQHLDSLITKRMPIYAIVLTHTGKNTGMITVARKLKRRRIPSLLICNQSSEELRSCCTEIINIIPTLNTKELSNVHFTIAIQYVLDVLYTTLLVKNLGLVKRVGENSGYYEIGEENDEL